MFSRKGACRPYRNGNQQKMLIDLIQNVVYIICASKRKNMRVVVGIVALLFLISMYMYMPVLRAEFGMRTRKADKTHKSRTAEKAAKQNPKTSAMLLFNKFEANYRSPMAVSRIENSRVVYKMVDGLKLRKYAIHGQEENPCLYDSPSFTPSTSKELTAAVCGVSQDAYYNPLRSIFTESRQYREILLDEMSSISPSKKHAFIKGVQDTCMENGRSYAIIYWVISQFCQFWHAGGMVSSTGIGHCISSAVLACELAREDMYNKMSATSLKYKRLLRNLYEKYDEKDHALFSFRLVSELDGMSAHQTGVSELFNALKRMIASLSAEISPNGISVNMDCPVEDISSSTKKEAKNCESDQACSKEFELDEQVYLQTRNNIESPLYDIADKISKIDIMLTTLKISLGTKSYCVHVNDSDIEFFNAKTVKKGMIVFSDLLEKYAIKAAECEKAMEYLNPETDDYPQEQTAD
ncbi:uncharacterized protein NEMAJ01_0531 [Nematocida major]|uniref:uncharacterized protein n=1 Tax=Nematocida major TaxID=1912982 RepID=UPI002008B723|nr:uncharacterized protein NEMAJ01_0531 [Nematocida major]KAH9385635.1 hypothetical protein NEMAJ01_0531 [Nematocida major]